MNTSRIKKLILYGFLVCVVVICMPAEKAETKVVVRQLATRFSDVILSGLAPGMVYSLKKEQGLPYTVMNGADSAVDLENVVQIPLEKMLKEGYEAVPDVSWVKVVPELFHLEAGESMDCDVIISIPEEEKYEGRHFQAMVKTQTVEKVIGGGGIAISFALMSRIRFSTGATPEKVMDEYRSRIMNALKIDVLPLSLNIGEVPLGEYVDLDGFEYPTVQLVNRGKKNYRIEFKLAKNTDSYGIGKDYEKAPGDIKVKFVKAGINLKSMKIKDIRMRIMVPEKEEYKGKSYAIIVLAQIKGLDIPLNLYARIYFKTEEKHE